MRKRFYLTAEQERVLDDAAEATVALTNLRDGSVPQRNPLSEAWDALGRELGFDSLTVTFPGVDDDDGDWIEAEVTK